MRPGQAPLQRLLLRIMPPSLPPVPACTPRLCCRRTVLRCRNSPTQADRSTLRQRPYAGGLFYFAATALRRRNYSTLRQRKLESDAERYCGRDRCHSGGFYLGLCRLRGILSPPALHDFAAGGPFFFAGTTAAGGPFYFAATKIGIGRSSLLRPGQTLLRRLFT